MDYLNGSLYHFRDNVSGLEVDSILDFDDGEYAAIEIKLGAGYIDEAANNLLKFKERVDVDKCGEPSFLMVFEKTITKTTIGWRKNNKSNEETISAI